MKRDNDIEHWWQRWLDNRDPLARDQLIVHYSPLVKFVAGRVGAAASLMKAKPITAPNAMAPSWPKIVGSTSANTAAATASASGHSAMTTSTPGS